MGKRRAGNVEVVGVARVLAGIAACAVCVMWCGACAKPLLSPDEPRSQFDRSDRLRGRSAPPYVTNEFGDRRPNVRGRLLGGE
ncbi:MAG TPA: hypothetical protein VK157_05790 [Phycisphaerales bacterium]|nr:hypothetical protein [Phycisphaerales bacterium]